MKSKKEEIIKTTAIKKSFSHTELLNALYYIDDVLSRGAVPYFVIKDTADSVTNDKDMYGEAVYLGIRHNDWVSSAFNVVDLVAESKEIDKNTIEYDYQGVPIIIKIFKKNHSCIESTDPKPYAMEYFYVPNPYQTFEQLYL